MEVGSGGVGVGDDFPGSFRLQAERVKTKSRTIKYLYIIYSKCYHKFVKRIIFVIVGLLYFWAAQPSMALKQRVWKSTTTKKTTSTAVTSSVGVSVRKVDRQNIRISFSNVKATSKIDYELTYNSSGTEQGVFGTVKPSEGNSLSRTLYFGTCSNKVCRPHTGISNARLTVTMKLNTGKTLKKRYSIKF